MNEIKIKSAYIRNSLIFFTTSLFTCLLLPFFILNNVNFNFLIVGNIICFLFFILLLIDFNRFNCFNVSITDTSIQFRHAFFKDKSVEYSLNELSCKKVIFKTEKREIIPGFILFKNNKKIATISQHNYTLSKKDIDFLEGKFSVNQSEDYVFFKDILNVFK